ncbi:MAG: hypothetical protein ACO1OD_09060 [Croceibacterium sp.]|jgi:hypothetical protein
MRAFHLIMRILNTILGLLMMTFGAIWILQGLGIAFLDSFMANDRQWAVWGTLLALFGLANIIWSNTRRP